MWSTRSSECISVSFGLLVILKYKAYTCRVCIILKIALNVIFCIVFMPQFIATHIIPHAMCNRPVMQKLLKILIQQKLFVFCHLYGLIFSFFVFLCVCFKLHYPVLQIPFKRILWFFTVKIILRWVKSDEAVSYFRFCFAIRRNCESLIVVLYIFLDQFLYNTHVPNDNLFSWTVRSVGVHILVLTKCFL